MSRVGVLLAASLAAVALSCGKAEKVYREIAGPEPGRYRVTITTLAMSESDFTNSALGTPKPVKLSVLKDGGEVFSRKVEGYRGPKDPGISFEVDYDSSSRYELKIEEVALVTTGKTWNWQSAEPGNWIFDEGRKNFGSGSSIEFRDEKVR